MPDRPSLDALREAAQKYQDDPRNQNRWRFQAVLNVGLVLDLLAEVERLAPLAAAVDAVRERCVLVEARQHVDQDASWWHGVNAERAAILALLPSTTEEGSDGA